MYRPVLPADRLCCLIAVWLFCLLAAGYLMADVDKEVSADLKKKLDALPDTIKTRCLW